MERDPEVILEAALKNRTNQLGKNPGELTVNQVAEVTKNPKDYLPDGYSTSVEEEVSVPQEAPKPAIKPAEGRRGSARGK